MCEQSWARSRIYCFLAPSSLHFQRRFFQNKQTAACQPTARQPGTAHTLHSNPAALQPPGLCGPALVFRSSLTAARLLNRGRCKMSYYCSLGAQAVACYSARLCCGRVGECQRYVCVCVRTYHRHTCILAGGCRAANSRGQFLQRGESLIKFSNTRNLMKAVG